MATIQIAVIFVFLSCVISIAWATWGGFFQTHGEQPGEVVGIKFFGTFFALCHLLVLVQPNQVRGVPVFIAFIFYLSSLWIFWHSIYVNRKYPLLLAFSEKYPERLTKTGPYRYVRHPFYVSYGLAWGAGVIATQEPWLLITLVVMGFIYYKAARFEEHQFLDSSLKEEYRSYQQKAGMFFPKVLQMFSSNFIPIRFFTQKYKRKSNL